MNLIGLRLCEHDSNISFYDGKNFYYYKSERDFQTKHHAFDNLWEWKEIVYKLWNLKEKDIDDTAIVLDPWRHKLPMNNEEFFPAIENYPHTPFKASRLNHHYAHALSTEVMYDDIKGHIIIDGYGDWNQAVTIIKNNKVIKKLRVSENESLGQLYSRTAAKAFQIQAPHAEDIAGKLMGLQSYGRIDQDFYKTLNRFTFENIGDVFNTGLFIDFKKNEMLAGLEKLSWIATIHKKTGELLVDYFKKFFKKNDSIGYSGGVAQNVLWNTELKKHFPNLKILPYCADEGLSVGAVEYLRRKYKLNKPIIENFPYSQSDEAPPTQPTSKTLKQVAKALSNNKLVLWYQGHGEIGPRALGNRSILFNPFNKKAREIVNRVKNRETYRPFGASVLKEDAHRYLKNPIDNPYMLYVSDITNSKLYGIKHVDNTCRYQTVDIDQSKTFYNLLKEFKKVTGESILLNTSLNIGGKPIMGFKKNLLSLIEHPDIDMIVFGNEIIKKYGKSNIN